jgi:hypothetical protein
MCVTVWGAELKGRRREEEEEETATAAACAKRWLWGPLGHTPLGHTPLSCTQM